MAATKRSDARGGVPPAPTGPRPRAEEPREARRKADLPDGDVTATREEPPAERLAGEMESGMLSGVGDEGDLSNVDGEESDLSPEEARRVLTAPAPGEARQSARA